MTTASTPDGGGGPATGGDGVVAVPAGLPLTGWRRVLRFGYWWPALAVWATAAVVIYLTPAGASLNVYLTLTGVLVGFLVGLTGVGGAALWREATPSKKAA